MDRRLIAPPGPHKGYGWQELRARFRWSVPERFNMGWACCDSWARAEPERIALIHLPEDGAPRRWSYGALADASDRFAGALRARGVRRGDRIAVLLPQGPETLIAHFAAYKLGAIVLPLFTLFGPDALAFRLADSGTRAVVTDAANLDKLMALLPELPELRLIYRTGPGPAAAPVLSMEAEIGAASDGFLPEDTAAEDPAVLIYTSGTTGPPKGVLHAHRFLLGHLPMTELSHDFFPRAGDCCWTPADWAWIGGLMDLAMPALFYGVPLVSCRMRKFDPEAAYRLIADQRARNLFLPPTALKMMRAAPVPEGVKIRSIASGGESLGKGLLDWARDRLSVEINEIYGQTECNLVVGTCRRLDPVPDGMMGKAIPGHEVAIIDAAGTVLPPGTQGEIAVRRPDPVMFLRYWNLPEKTAEKFIGDWLRTGDLGTMDAEGRFTFASRDDDVITSAGYRIGPTEIENCLMTHPDVVMAAVVGVPDPLRTEIVKAFVILRPGAERAGLDTELVDLVRARVSPHVAPRAIEWVESLPMTATGKVMRRALRESPAA